MADDTFAARGINRVWQSGSGEGRKIFLANGTDIIAGYAVTQEGETAGTNDIDLCAAGEEFAGVVLQPVNTSYGDRPVTLDEANQDNEPILVQQPGFHNVVYMRMIAGAGTMKRGTKLMIASEAGKVTKAAVAAGTPGSPSDAELTTMLNTVVGTPYEDYTNDATDDTLVKVLI